MSVEHSGELSNYDVIKEAAKVAQRAWHGNNTDGLREASVIVERVWRRIMYDYTFVPYRENSKDQESLFDELASLRMEGCD